MPEMPFPDQGGFIAAPLQASCDGGLAGLNAGLLVLVGHEHEGAEQLVPGATRVATGEQAES